MKLAHELRRNWRLCLILYPFVAGAVAVNLFMLSLIAPVVNLPVLSPTTALILGIPLGIPATLYTARWFRRLMDSD